MPNGIRRGRRGSARGMPCAASGRVFFFAPYVPPVALCHRVRRTRQQDDAASVARVQAAAKAQPPEVLNASAGASGRRPITCDEASAKRGRGNPPMAHGRVAKAKRTITKRDSIAQTAVSGGVVRLPQMMGEAYGSSSGSVQEL